MATPDFTVSDLCFWLRYEPDTGLFFSVRGRFAGREVGGLRNGYVYVGFLGAQYRAHRLAWFVTHGRWPKDGIDHIDGNKQNNRISNLREADSLENNQNMRSARSTSKSGLLGAFFEASSGKWRSTIRVNGKNHNIGRFATAQEAHEAYVNAKRRLHATCTL